MARLADLAVQLASGMARDVREADSLVRASSESHLFQLLASRRGAAAADLRAVDESRRALAELQKERPEALQGELRQTFSSAVPLVQRCQSVLRYPALRPPPFLSFSQAPR